MQTLLAATNWMPWAITAVIGLVAGLLARAILPGRQHMNFLLTMVLGVAGAFLGFYLKGFFGLPGGSDLLWQVIFATGGALILLIVLSLLGIFKK